MEHEWVSFGTGLAAAVGCGVALGLKRTMRDTPIGMRTFAIVCMGASIVTMATVHFPGMIGHPDANSRVLQGIIQGIMTGVSFICAGVILRDTSAGRVEGITTAATVWVTAALGIACGVGAWALDGLGFFRWMEMTGSEVQLSFHDLS
jgi:putative Mg2+ transporter-C (MgtC) family protein